MNDILTDGEKRFLAWYGLSPEDIFDARGMSGRAWKRLIQEEGKTLALGTRCRSAGHRLRTRAGHCVQCDPKKLAFQKRHRAEQYVYIAGSLSTKLIKIGTCRDVPQRQRQMRAERYGGADDWAVIFSVKVRNAGEIESKARAKINRYAVVRSYWKDGFKQDGIEALQCSFSRAKEALLSAAEGSKLSEPWGARFTFQYEFDEPA